MSTHQFASQCVVKNFHGQSGLAGAGNTGDADKLAERDIDCQVFEVVFPSADYAQFFSGTVAAAFRNWDEFSTAEVRACDGIRRGFDLLRRALRYQVSALLARAGTKVYHPVSRTDGFIVVLHNQQRVAEVPQAF